MLCFVRILLRKEPSDDPIPEGDVSEPSITPVLPLPSASEPSISPAMPQPSAVEHSGTMQIEDIPRAARQQEKSLPR
jgi:hypothetical protein